MGGCESKAALKILKLDSDVNPGGGGGQIEIALALLQKVGGFFTETRIYFSFVVDRS